MKEPKKHSKFVSKMIGSLSLRVLLVTFFLLIIPLLFYVFTMSFRDYNLQMRKLILQLDAVGKMHHCKIDQSIQSQLQNLLTVSNTVDFDELTTNRQATEETDQLFTRIATSEDLSSLFYITIDSDGSYTIIASKHLERKGRKSPATTDSLLGKSMLEVQKKGYLVFLGMDPWNNLKQMYVATAIYERNNPSKIIGILGSAVPAKQLLELLKSEQYETLPFDLALLDRNGEIFESTDPTLTLEHLQLLPADKLTDQLIREFSSEEQWENLFHLFEENQEYLGLDISIASADFSLLVEVPEKVVSYTSNREDFFRLISFMAFIILIGGAGTYWLTRRFSRPLKSLGMIMEEVGAGDLNARYKPDWMGFEINVLGTHFNEMVDSLGNYIESAKNERVAKEILKQELEIGLEIQKTIIPSIMPEFPGIDLSARFIPAREVGGDFYDVFVKKADGQEKLFFAVADASGKGISACLYSLCVRSMLRSFDTSSNDLKLTISETDALFSQDTRDTGMFVTAWIGEYDPKTKRLDYSSCGHHAAILKRANGEIEELITPGIALGVKPGEKVHIESCQLSSGDLLLLYTDGVLEAHDERMNLFGYQRLLEILYTYPNATSQELIDHLFNAIDKFAHGVMQHDDLTALVIRIL